MSMLGGLLLAGCATTIRSDVTIFHEWPAELPDKSYVFERTETQENNLEYRNYERLVRTELHRLGFTQVSNTTSTKLKVSMSYNVHVRDVRVVEPVVIDPYWRNPAWRGHYSPFHDPFWFGPPIVEQRETNYELFKRELKVTITQTPQAKTLYDVTVVSQGLNDSLAVVMPYMVRSAFADFPGKSGVPRRVELKIKE